MSFFPGNNFSISINGKVRLVAFIILWMPVYIFIIGDFYGKGFQAPLFRYQEIFLGSFVVLISRDFYHVITGFSTGPGILPVILWGTGAVLLVLNLLLLFIRMIEPGRRICTGGFLIIISALLFLFSIMAQYGPGFKGPAGIAIPLGLPLLFLIGGWMIVEGRKVSKQNQEPG